MKTPVTSSATPAAPVDLSQADPAGAVVSTKPQLDHDKNDEPGGSAPPPRHQHLVVLKDSKARGLQHGEVILASPEDAKALLHTDVVRNATSQDVELAQPRIRVWTA
ncbi:hypothetical protein [Brevundimonas sp.]|uniref:hypothetical protein n=1 Tax=Brevundimonas sp. TaxID=1871086 RepID=UPI002FCC54A1